MYNAERAEFIAMLDEVYIRSSHTLSPDLQARVSAFLREKRSLQSCGVLELLERPMPPKPPIVRRILEGHGFIE